MYQSKKASLSCTWRKDTTPSANSICRFVSVPWTDLKRRGSPVVARRDPIRKQGTIAASLQEQVSRQQMAGEEFG